MFLITLKYKLPLVLVDKYLAEHRDYLDKFYQTKKLIFSGPYTPRTGGVILAQFTDRAEVDAMIQGDPFFTQEVADYDVKEFNPVKYHENFASFVG